MYLGAQILSDVQVYLDGRIDHWSLDISYPTDLDFSAAFASDGMSVPFVNRNGQDSVYNAPLSVLPGGTTISSTITKLGYWDYDNDGTFDAYGTIKWEDSYYDSMFILRLEVRSNFRSGVLSFDGFLSSTIDWRPANYIYQGQFTRNIYFYVGLLRGDVTGDDVINIADVSMLTDYLLNQVEFDEFQLDAADVDGNGVVGISDLSELTDMLS